MLNGVDELIMMKGDVLNGMDSISAATAYQYEGAEHKQVPSNMVNTPVEPVYSQHKGWSKDIDLSQGYDAMDQEFRDYIEYIEQYIGHRISVISMGPEREKTLQR